MAWENLGPINQLARQSFHYERKIAENLKTVLGQLFKDSIMSFPESPLGGSVPMRGRRSVHRCEVRRAWTEKAEARVLTLAYGGSLSLSLPYYCPEGQKQEPQLPPSCKAHGFHDADLCTKP